jgi:uncharacterized protein
MRLPEMEILRILVTGGVGATKTSLIHTMSEIEAVDTDKKATDEVPKLKDKTTVALDFGRLTLAPNQSIHLYGTPGQARFDFMWDILLENADAYILLIDTNNPENISQSYNIYQSKNHDSHDNWVNSYRLFWCFIKGSCRKNCRINFFNRRSTHNGS